MATDSEAVVAPSFGAAKDFEQARRMLIDAEFNESAIRDRLAIPEVSTPRPKDVPVWLHRTREGTPLDLLIRLFMLGTAVETQACEKALAPIAVSDWVAGGLIEHQDGKVVGNIHLVPFAGQYVASDLPMRLQTDDARANFVMGIGGSTQILANFAVRRQVDDTLDLGSGGGALSLLAAKHSTSVQAVDRNDRAISFARFNAQLNGLSNIDASAGDLFEPVCGREFDLILSNPPFVISPASAFLFRDSGMQADGLCQRIVQEAPPMLREGGFLQMTVNWAHMRGERWQDRISKWFQGSGCDVLIFKTRTWDAISYADMWLSDGAAHDRSTVVRNYEQWISEYDRLGIEAVSDGAIMMRKRSGGENWLHTTDGPEKMTGPCGQAVLQAFALRTYLAESPDDRALLEARFHIAPDVRLVQECQPGEGGWQHISAQVRLARGFTFTGNVDLYIANLLAHCNGQRTLGELIAELAQTVGKDVDALRATVLTVVRTLIEHGFLLPESIDHV